MHQYKGSFPSILYIRRNGRLQSVEDRLHQLLSMEKIQIRRGICTQVCYKRFNDDTSECTTEVMPKSLQNELINSEKQRRAERLYAHYRNDVWQKREKPPENWNDPLPEWMQKEFQNSYLHIRNQEMKQGTEVSVLDSKCTIL